MLLQGVYCMRGVSVPHCGRDLMRRFSNGEATSKQDDLVLGATAFASCGRSLIILNFPIPDIVKASEIMKVFCDKFQALSQNWRVQMFHRRHHAFLSYQVAPADLPFLFWVFIESLHPRYSWAETFPLQNSRLVLLLLVVWNENFAKIWWGASWWWPLYTFSRVTILS